MTILRAYRARIVSLIAILLLTAACQSAPPKSTAPPIFAITQLIPATTTIQSPDRVWGEQPAGTQTVRLEFYDSRCIRLSLPSQQTIERCSALGSNIVAVQKSFTDSSGQPFTAVAGRAFSAKITVVALELGDGQSIPVPVRDGGFLVVLPGRRMAVAGVPIDQFGNLVGTRYLMQ